MKRFLFALLFALVAQTAAAQAPPPAQKALLKGDWQAINDASDIMRVRAEVLPDEPAGDGMLMLIADRSCEGGKPKGSWYLEDFDGNCCVVVSVNATMLKIKPASGQGTISTYKRRPAPTRKK